MLVFDSRVDKFFVLCLIDTNAVVFKYGVFNEKSNLFSHFWYFKKGFIKLKEVNMNVSWLRNFDIKIKLNNNIFLIL